MKKLLKRSLALVMSVILIAGLMCMGVSAADERPVRVELDGKAIAFTDAEPQIIGGRTYVPFRAVFEALGAEVDFDAETRTVSASRNGTTVSIPIGSSTITVQQDGISYKNIMDAAAFISEAGRTYIPVRYAAEALGCCVGWDADDRTVILVDTEAMVNEAAYNGEFKLVEAYLDYVDKFSQGSYEVKMKMNMAATVLATKVMTMDCDISGIVAGQTAGEMSMTMKMDMGGLVNLLTKLGGDEADKKEILDSFAEAGMTNMKMNVTVQARVDLDKGTMYMNMSGVPGMEAVLPADTWLYIDMNDIFGDLAGDYFDIGFLSMDGGIRAEKLVASMINEMGYVYDKDTAYDEIKTQVDAIVGAFADSAFVKNGRSYTNTQKIDAMGMTVSLRLDTNAAGEVAGYEIGVDASIAAEELGLSKSILAEAGRELGEELEADELKLTMRAGINAQNKETVKMELTMGNVLLLTVNADGTYTPTAKTPNTGLPAGAKSIGFEQWMMSLY